MPLVSGAVTEFRYAAAPDDVPVIPAHATRGAFDEARVRCTYSRNGQQPRSSGRSIVESVKWRETPKHPTSRNVVVGPGAQAAPHGRGRGDRASLNNSAPIAPPPPPPPPLPLK